MLFKKYCERLESIINNLIEKSKAANSGLGNDYILAKKLSNVFDGMAEFEDFRRINKDNIDSKILEECNDLYKKVIYLSCIDNVNIENILQKENENEG